MNTLLNRQIQKFIGSLDTIPEELLPLFKAINEAYEDFEKDRTLIERSLDLSSKELMEVNNKLRKEVEVRKYAEEKQAELLDQVMKANEELTRFAYVMTHDLKSPLRGISTLAAWLKDDHSRELSEEAISKLNQINNRTQRMHNLIDGLLAYIRLISSPDKISAIDTNVIIQQTVESLELPENIQVCIKKQLPVIECARGKITQIFQHLIQNSIRFIDKQQGLIEINCIERPQYWEFSISDNGSGIDKKYYGKIFKMFQTLERWEISGSAGIGLPIVKKAVEILGGRIWVESNVGEGSIFYFTVPKNSRSYKLNTSFKNENSISETSIS
ncbi:MAG: hypothetical protein JW787_16235 [Sedimentisphaerales bacterium]|nr:hypothetical protein [Sedimentisphaerales bacterium]